MSLENERINPELDALFALDHKISIGVVVFRMVGFFWQGHLELKERWRRVVEKVMR